MAEVRAKCRIKGVRGGGGGLDTATRVEEVKSQKAANWGSETGVQEAWRG